MSQLKHFLLRVTVTLLLLLVPILGVWTFVKAPDWGLWFPKNFASCLCVNIGPIVQVRTAPVAREQ